MLGKLGDEERSRWAREVEWYLGCLRRVVREEGEEELVVCHNDVNMNNFLIPDEEPEKLVSTE